MRISFAKQKWLKLPRYTRQKILGAVWCAKCRKSVSITDCTCAIINNALKLTGRCPDCGGAVVRVVDEV